MIFVDICFFLLPVFFGDHQIDVADRFQKLFPLLIGEVAFFLLFVPVELVRGQGDDQIISQGFCPAEEVDVAVMKKIEGP